MDEYFTQLSSIGHPSVISPASREKAAQISCFRKQVTCLLGEKGNGIEDLGHWVEWVMAASCDHRVTRNSWENLEMDSEKKRRVYTLCSLFVKTPIDFNGSPVRGNESLVLVFCARKISRQQYQHCVAIMSSPVES